MTRMVGCMIWWEEEPAWLHRAVTSLGKLPIDHLVALDGAFALMPNGTPASQPDQGDAIRQACDEIDATCTIHVPDDLWSGEVEKRSRMFHLAEQHAEPMVDWYVVMDADQTIGPCPKNLKARLEATDLDCADTLFIERPATDAATHTASRFRVRNFFRAIPGLHVEDNHYTYKDGERFLWGNQNNQQLEPALDLTDLRIAHRTKHRDEGRRARQQAYYRERDKAKVELSPCADCGGQASCTVNIDYRIERIHGQPKLICGRIDVCERCVKPRARKAIGQLERMGVDPTKMKWEGYAHIPG